MAGRLLLACYVSAKMDRVSLQIVQARQAIQAASVLLFHLVGVLPISLGSAEVLSETARSKHQLYLAFDARLNLTIQRLQSVVAK